MCLPHNRGPLFRCYTYLHKCLDTLHSQWNNPNQLCDRNSAECHIPSYNYVALLSTAPLEQHPCHIARAAVYPLLLFSQDYVGANVDQSLIPPSIFSPGGKHGGYGTGQLMRLEEGFQAAQNVYWWLLMKALQLQFI